MTTNVPVPTFGPTGFVAPDETDILAGFQADFQAAFNGALNFTNQETPQGQLTASLSALTGACFDLFVALANSVDPAFAQGRMQDAIARIYFLTRIPAQPTILQIVCVGLAGTVIPANTLISDPAGNLYQSTVSFTIPLGGSGVNAFSAQIPGPISVPAAVSIYQAIPGWDSITVQSGVVGRNTESQSAFETRREQSVAQNSLGSLSSVLGAVLSVAGVSDAFATENVNSTPLTIGGFTLAANSLYVAAVGGADADVARAIWSKKAPGCAYNGNTTVAVQDTNSGYNPPLPSYNVTFERPASLAIVFLVTIVSSTQVPADAQSRIGNAIVGAGAGADGGPRARVGATLLASRFNAPIAALGAWAQVISIKVGSGNLAAAVFTASFSGTVMTVTVLTSGVIAVGQTIVGQGVPVGTVITSLGSGAGGTGTYNLSNSFTLGSAAGFEGIVANQDSLFVGIAQTPLIAAANVKVVLV